MALTLGVDMYMLASSIYGYSSMEKLPTKKARRDHVSTPSVASPPQFVRAMYQTSFETQKW